MAPVHDSEHDHQPGFFSSQERGSMTIAIIAAVCVTGVLALAFQVIEPLAEARAGRRRRRRSANHGFLSLP
jgi:hypothetical protein